MPLNLSRPEHDAGRTARRSYWQHCRDAMESSSKELSDRQLGTELTLRLQAHVARQQQIRPFVVGVYWPIRREPDLRGLWQDWQQASNFAGLVRLALPQVQAREKPLRFLAWEPGASLHEGAYGACLPNTEAEEVFPDLLIVPCLAFRRVPQGVLRLGYGGGYYDRTLAERECLTWGVAYAWQEDMHLDAQPHDRPLNAIVCV